MVSVAHIKRLWLLVTICLFGGGLLMWMNDVRFDFHQNINLHKYIKRKFELPPINGEAYIFQSQYGANTTTMTSRNNIPNKDLLYAANSNTSGGKISPNML